MTSPFRNLHSTPDLAGTVLLSKAAVDRTGFPGLKNEAGLTEFIQGSTAEQRWQLEIAARLRRDDVEALLELYDWVAPRVFGYALAIARNRRQAIRAIRQAFLDVWEAPVMLSDSRVPAPVAIAALITRAVDRQPPDRSVLLAWPKRSPGD